jgi:hypothetical protein
MFTFHISSEIFKFLTILKSLIFPILRNIPTFQATKFFIFVSYSVVLKFMKYQFGLENREYGRGDPVRWPRNTLYPQKLALTSPTSGGRSVGIVCLRTKASE